MQKQKVKKQGVNRNYLKYIAVIAMILDHIAIFFCSTQNIDYYIYRIVGRITCPIMAYFLAEGYVYTKSKVKYGTRLFIFAMISQIPYSLVQNNTIFGKELNFIMNLFISFTILLNYEKIKNKTLKTIIILSLIVISSFCDWGIYVPLLILSFYIFRNDNKKKTILFIIIALAYVLSRIILITPENFSEVCTIGIFLFIPIIKLYNGEPGEKSKFNKWFFYIIYPLHLFIIYLIQKIG